MKKFLKWIGVVVALLVVAGIGLVVAANLLFERKRERVIKVDVKAVPVVADAAALERGKYLFMSRGCGDCHGANGAGRAFINEPEGGFYVRSPNITPAGVVGAYTERDWVRAIRHGVKPDGRPLFIMPSEDYNRFTDRDVAALIAYARSLPAVSSGSAEFRVPLPVKATLRRGRRQGFGGEDRPQPAASVASARRCDARAWQVRRKSLHRLSRRTSVGRQDSRRSAELAGRVQPDSRSGNGADGLRQCRQVQGDVSQRQTP